MDDESLIANVDDTRHAVASVEGGRRAWVILDCAVVVAMLDFLRKENENYSKLVKK